MVASFQILNQCLLLSCLTTRCLIVAYLPDYFDYIIQKRTQDFDGKFFYNFSFDC